jgi:hypothetical protein
LFLKQWYFLQMFKPEQINLEYHLNGFDKIYLQNHVIIPDFVIPTGYGMLI